ncbi:MAG: ABC transporter permease [Acidobacteriota bacterium]
MSREAQDAEPGPTPEDAPGGFGQQSPWRVAARNIRRSPMACIGLFLIGGFVLVALGADFIAPYPYDQIVTDRSEYPPTEPDLSKGRIMGTDDLGRDIFSRLVYGSRISLMVGLIGQAIALVIGITIGAVAGYFGGWPETVLMRFTDLVFSMPVALICIVIVGTFPGGQGIPFVEDLPHPDLAVIFTVLGFLNWPSVARLVRGQVLTVRELEFTAAAQAMGASEARILLRHVIPNSLAPILVAATIGIAGNILTEAWLSFLGIGAKPPTASWGKMIAEGQPFLTHRPWVCLAPGLAIMFTVLGFNLLGDGLRDALDPRLRGGKKV